MWVLGQCSSDSLVKTLTIFTKNSFVENWIVVLDDIFAF